MRNINDAIRLSWIFGLMMIALKLDGGGRLDALPVWVIVPISTAPVVAHLATNAVMFTLARLAYFFRSR